MVDVYILYVMSAAMSVFSLQAEGHQNQKVSTGLINMLLASIMVQKIRELVKSDGIGGAIIL